MLFSSEFHVGFFSREFHMKMNSVKTMWINVKQISCEFPINSDFASAYMLIANFCITMHVKKIKDRT